VAQLYPRALGSISVASYDSQDYGGGILTRLQTGQRTGQNGLYTRVYIYIYIYGNESMSCIE
jgi:hypothetical protein